MGMSTDLVGLRDPKDPKHLSMVSVLNVCEKAGVTLPPEVRAYFDPKNQYGDYPDPDNALNVPIEGAVSKWTGEMAEGVEVDLSKLPPGVKVLRFYNSW